MIHSTTYISRNEDGLREIHIERDMYLKEVIAEAWRHRSFRFDKMIVKKYVNIGSEFGVHAYMSDVWINKDTKARASDTEHLACLEVLVNFALGELAERAR